MTQCDLWWLCLKVRVKREDDSTEKAVLREKLILVGDTGEGDADGCGHPCHVYGWGLPG